MRINDLLEARRNPEENPKFSAVEFLRQYKDNPHMYLHLAPIQKVGIYPKSSDSHDSPVGIYAFRLADIWENDIERWNTGDYADKKARGLEFLSYHGGNFMFILESDIDPYFADDYSEQDLANDITKLKQITGIDDETVDQLKKAARTNLNFVDKPVGYLWGMTKALVGGVREFDEHTYVNTKKWNTLLRTMGYTGFNDTGYGYIHGAEHQQALFLSTAAFRVVDMGTIKQKQKTVKIGDQSYEGGRIPKDLHMRGFDSVFFYNNSPEDFKSVRTWTVDGISLDNFKNFIRFLPWNAKGIIKTMSMGGASNELFEEGNVKRFFETTTIPQNITLEKLYIGSRFPERLLRHVPENFPVAEIVISPFSNEYGLDKLPATIQNKITKQKFGQD